jgi:rhodanese-related sulfurtransferase
MRLYGKQVHVEDLVKPDYIGSDDGSTFMELTKAAKDHGMYALTVRKLTSRELRRAHVPIILHVKSDATGTIYDHYELFLGTGEGKARIFDPPNPIRLVPFYELAPRWDGMGLMISAAPIKLGTLFAPARRRLIGYTAVTVAIISIVRWARRRWLAEAATTSRRRYWELSLAQAVGLAIAALLCGMFYHFANEEGLLANTSGVASIQQAHLGNFIPKISERELSKLLNGDAVFIDARYARDFEAGHLERAISVPVDANDLRRQKGMAQVAKDARIVVYCQSAGCKFAEKVAIKLMEDGFSNVSIFKGGWREWAAKGDD